MDIGYGHIYKEREMIYGDVVYYIAICKMYAYACMYVSCMYKATWLDALAMKLFPPYRLWRGAKGLKQHYKWRQGPCTCPVCHVHWCPTGVSTSLPCPSCSSVSSLSYASRSPTPPGFRTPPRRRRRFATSPRC